MANFYLYWKNQQELEIQTERIFRDHKPIYDNPIKLDDFPKDEIEMVLKKYETGKNQAVIEDGNCK